MKKKKKIHRFTLDMKYKIITLYENAPRGEKKDILQAYRITRPYICKWKKDMDKYVGVDNKKTLHLGAKKILTKEMEENILKKINKLREKDVAITGRLIRKLASEEAKKAGLEEFRASQGWLDRFKIRHNLYSPEKSENKSRYFINRPRNHK